MRILITNDDSVHYPGIESLERVARQLTDDVWIVAPETDQSGVAHSLSLSHPLRLRQLGPKHFAVRGTPSDCVVMGIRHLLDFKPDLVLSGVNGGQNVAEDVIYSGTVAGALEGVLLGVPGIALSQAYGRSGRDNIRWDCAEAHAPGVIRRILELGIPPETVVNVNFPDRAPEDVTGVALTRQGRRPGELLRIDERKDGRGFPYYWVVFERPKFEPGADSDLEALSQGKVSVTPLKFDMTCDAVRERWRTAFA